LQDWGEELIERMQPYAEMLDDAFGHKRHVTALGHQLEKVRNTELTPAARLLHGMQEHNVGLHEYTLMLSKQHHDTLTQGPMEPELLQRYIDEAAASLAEQAQMEADDTESFSEYVARFEAALRAP